MTPAESGVKTIALLGTEVSSTGTDAISESTGTKGIVAPTVVTGSASSEGFSFLSLASMAGFSVFILHM